MAVIASAAFIISGFGLSNYLFAYGGLPIGWDTPHYIEQARIVASQGPFALIAVQGPYDVVYQLFLGFLVWLGISAFTLETILPVALAATIPFLLSRLTLTISNVRQATLVAVVTPGWFAVYYVGAELHANLLGLVLMLGAFSLLLKTKSLREPRSVLGLGLIGISSFAHIETTLFLVVVMIAAAILASLFPVKLALSSVGVVIPAALIFLIHVTQRFGLVGGSIPLYPLDTIWFWLVVFGPVLPLALWGLIDSALGPRTRLETLAVFWASGSLILGVSQYLDSSLYIFAERALVLIPIPILAAIGFQRFQSWAKNQQVRNIGRQKVWRWAAIGVFILLVVSWPISYWAGATATGRVYLAPSAAQRLEWISSNLRFQSTPVFVYNDLDQVAGSYGDFYNNWVGSIVGTHLSYLGRVSYLVQVKETPYNNTNSRLFSAIFMSELRNAGIASKTSLLTHPIILVEDFYNPFPPVENVTHYFYQVSNGIFEGNNTLLGALTSTTQPTFSPIIESDTPQIQSSMLSHANTWQSSASTNPAFSASGTNDSWSMRVEDRQELSQVAA